MGDYPSNISREQFEIIREELESAKKKTKPRQKDIYEIFCAILYVIKGGIQWRMLPKDFPKWQIVYYYFRVWKTENTDGKTWLDIILAKTVVLLRNDALRKDKTTMGIVDAQSVQNADTAEESGYDGGKKNNWHKASYIS